MIRRIIKIDEEKCNGCGLCARACHEGAIGMVDGKAKLLRENYCDGLGDCLPACPVNAISFEDREAPAYDAAAVAAAQKQKNHSCPSGGCPGSAAQAMERKPEQVSPKLESCLRQWPVQIKLAPSRAPWFAGADLLIAADCTAYAYGNFHNDFIKNRITLIGCPKLDMVDYSEKLTAILANNDIRSVTVVRMEVPCCGGIEFAAKRALQTSGKDLPVQVITVSVEGKIIEN